MMTRVGSPRAKPPQHLEAVDAGQAHVEHEQVVGAGERAAVRSLAVGRDVDRVARSAKRAREPVAQQRVVLGDQHAHPHSVAKRGRARGAVRNLTNR